MTSRKESLDVKIEDIDLSKSSFYCRLSSLLDIPDKNCFGEGAKLEINYNNRKYVVIVSYFLNFREREELKENVYKILEVVGEFDKKLNKILRNSLVFLGTSATLAIIGYFSGRVVHNPLCFLGFEIFSIGAGIGTMVYSSYKLYELEKQYGEKLKSVIRKEILGYLF